MRNLPRRLARLTVLLALPAADGLCQPPGAAAPPEVATASAALAAGHADSAIALLEDYFARNPNALPGRMVLGNAYRLRGRLDDALRTYRVALGLPPARLQARFGIAAVHARRAAADSALEHLRFLKGSGAFDMDASDTAPEFATLRSHPRYAETRFRPGDFEQPFVEPVRIIHEWRAEARGDQFSWIARGIGDVDGDGVSEIVTSAPTHGERGQQHGRVYLYSGKSGRQLWAYTGNPGDNLGTGLEGAGDVNGDGIPDVVAGAPNRTSTSAGRALVLSGRDGRVIHMFNGTAGEAFGSSTVGIGDQDGDGTPDVAVGAPMASGRGEGSGRVYVYSGKTGTLLSSIDGERANDGFGSIVGGNKRGKLAPLLVGAPRAGRGTGRVYVFDPKSTTPRFIIESDTTGAALGAMFTSIVGDVDGDGTGDVYASDFVNSARGPATGRVYVHSGKDGRRLLTITGDTAGAAFGVGSADVGDVDKDGRADLLLGAWQYAGAAPSGGRITLHSGGTGKVLRTITGRVPGETLGFDAAGVGDVDGDGTPDFLVTSSWSNIAGFRSGRMYVISGR